MLLSFAMQLDASKTKRHLFFLAVTIFTLLLTGYNFGVFDEAMHVPFLKAIVNPGLYPGDPMISLKEIYYSYFWYFFVPFLKLGWLEPTLFIVHVATIYLSFWALWNLSDGLFHDPLTSIFSVLAFIVPHFGFVGFPVIEFAPLSRTFVLPFLIIALDQFLRGRIPLAFLIAGLMYNIHVVSVNFILAMFGLACLLEFRRIGWQRILLGAVLFVAAALPVLLWKAHGAPIDFSLRPEWVQFLNHTLFFHIFATVGFDYLWTLVPASGGLASMALFFIAARAMPDLPQRSTAQNFMFAGIIVVVVNLIAVYGLPVTIIIQSQIMRVGLWMLLLAYVFGAQYLAQHYRTGALPAASYGLLLGAFLASPFPLLTLLFFGLVKYVKMPALHKAVGVVSTLGFVVTALFFWYMDFYAPGIYIYGQATPWVDVQNWARTHTLETDRFITPPEKIGLQESDWRVHSERASVATLSELMVAAFEPGYVTDWESRFEMVAPGALAHFSHSFFGNINATEAAYYTLAADDLLTVACRLDAHYVVLEKPHTQNLPMVYDNEQFIVYDLQNQACPP